MKRLCTINARGGSKGVENKNIRLLGDKPLIAYSIIQAKLSHLFSYIAISSDSEEILAIAKQYGADILIKRPPELATDQAAKLPAIKHSLLETEKITSETFDIIVDLDATSPLRDVEDIIGAVQLIETSNVSNVLTGMPARRSPYFNMVEINEQGFVELSKKHIQEIVRRQDAPKVYDLNASIYVWKRQALLEDETLFARNTLLYEMPEERSIDIDSELDFTIVEFLMKQKGSKSL